MSLVTPSADVVSQLAILRQEHRDLDEEIRRYTANFRGDELTIKRMKKRKLWLKDCIAKLESELIPDQPA